MKSRILIALIVVMSSCLDDSVSEIEQLNIDVKKIDKYLAENPGDPDDIVVKDATGVRLVISELGTGSFPPNSGNNLKVGYTGRLFSDGTIFDSNTAFYLKISDNVINGWKIGLSLMTEGTRAKLYIPSGLAYGTSGQGGIPANAILVFDMYLEKVIPTDDQENRLTADIAAIDFQLEEESITASEDESGIRYVVTQIGSGATPSLFSQVRINFTGKLLSNGSVFQEKIEVSPNTQFSSRVINYISGLVVGLQLLQEGGTATFYIPSTLGYGPVAITGVPANSNLIVEIELLEVIN